MPRRVASQSGLRIAIDNLPTVASDLEQTMNKDQVKGRVEEATGKIKEVAGKATGSTSTEVKGKAQQVAGKTQAEYGDAKEDIKKGK